MTPQGLFIDEYGAMAPMPDRGICSRCGVIVLNSAFFKRASNHFKGICKPARIWDDTFIYELKHRKPKGTDWRYAPAGSVTCRRYYGS